MKRPPLVFPDICTQVHLHYFKLSFLASLHRFGSRFATGCPTRSLCRAYHRLITNELPMESIGISPPVSPAASFRSVEFSPNTSFGSTDMSTDASLGYDFEDSETRAQLELIDDLRKLGVSDHVGLPQASFSPFLENTILIRFSL
jgi:hypothetical protein